MTLQRILALVPFGLALTVPAFAGTLTQTVTRTQEFIVPISGSYTSGLIPDSFFATTFQPFVGTGLTSAVLTFTNGVSGTATFSAGGGMAIQFGGVMSLNGTGWAGDGSTTISFSGGPGSVQPVSLTEGPVSATDLLASYGQSQGFPALLTGTAPLSFTMTASNGMLHSNGSGGSFTLDLTVTTTQTLTYTFDGEGAIYAPAAVPEPASLTLLGIGLAGAGAIRRRGAAGPA
jgi:hypothetical protein